MTVVVDQVRRLWAKSTTGRAPEISPIVVIWGAFEPPVEIDRGVAYVRGDVLTSHLRSTEAAADVTDRTTISDEV
jgi:hypothetical protein